MALCIAWVIFAFCVIDLTLFPIPLIHDPTSYATFSGARLHVRHVSNMCWMLPVIGLLCARSLKVRILLIGMGLVFPVLVLDRNRLFAVAFACIVLMLLRRRRAIPWKTVGTLAVAAVIAFGVLGTYRSGNLAWVPLPFSPVFEGSPTVLKWLLLYASAGIYNFGAIMTKGYHNPEFLINQLVPGAGSVATLGTDIPLDAPTINIGTEFFPFLMALGPAGAFVAAMLLYLMVVGAFLLLRARLSVFTLLIFLRITYVSVMSSFAPQAYTWTNFGLIALCLLAMVLASLLPHAGRHASTASE
ncbi:hypothetical protein L602_002000000270 [Cupriavidus gilardii J11]|uniref:Uncharacterized protein n=1 Tax=Cupriavidus gilardii J11 TaxID=936133 RepID=A0A562BMT3_9BURK|nr:hypothetical protein [Cupriavidus gilardii]TWG86422.1 hypothetical protein L602_002000000270 [Cupriavidus gilardii J11]